MVRGTIAALRRFAPSLGVLALLVVAGGISISALSHPVPSQPGTIADRAAQLELSPSTVSVRAQVPSPNSAGPRPAAGPINPQGSYSAEPAPMGVADFGVNGLDQAYSYTTPIFQGTANLTALKANVLGNPSAGNVAFELNTILTFQLGAKSYVYWLQDGFDVDSHAEHVTLLQDYVWNESTSSASLNASSVSGNGSFVNYGGYNVYISYPPKTLPGYNISLSFPMLLELRVVTGTQGATGIPWVGYDYDDGFGWVRASNDSFPFAGGAVGVGQMVNGNVYTPKGAYYDAEFVYAGPGGGVGIDVGSRMNMTLERWTGHNLAPVPNAYNHGGNTGERIENLTVVAGTGTGSPGAALARGAGTLGLLYASTQTGLVRAIAPWSAGEIGVNGAPVAFSGGEADLTLLPGTYELTLYQGSEIVGRTSVLIAAGSNLTVDLTANLLEPVTVTASGLPTGTGWSIWWNGTRYNGTSPSIMLDSLNGTYSLATSAIPGYVPKVTELSVSVRGPTQATLSWTTFNYTVTFTESGLPAGTRWWVTGGGVQNLTTRSSLALGLPNGTDPFTVGCAFAYSPVSVNGNISVDAGPTSQTLYFDPKVSYIVGTVTPAGASIGIGQVTAPTDDGSFNVSVLPGHYVVSATLAGYGSFSENVTTTAGNVTSVTIALHALPANAPSASSGMVSEEEVVILAGVVAVVAIVAGVLFMRRRQRPPPTGE